MLQLCWLNSKLTSVLVSHGSKASFSLSSLRLSLSYVKSLALVQKKLIVQSGATELLCLRIQTFFFLSLLLYEIKCSCYFVSGTDQKDLLTISAFLLLLFLLAVSKGGCVHDWVRIDTSLKSCCPECYWQLIFYWFPKLKLCVFFLATINHFFSPFFFTMCFLYWLLIWDVIKW